MKYLIWIIIKSNFKTQKPHLKCSENTFKLHSRSIEMSFLNRHAINGNYNFEDYNKVFHFIFTIPVLSDSTNKNFIKSVSNFKRFWISTRTINTGFYSDSIICQWFLSYHSKYGRMFILTIQQGRKNGNIEVFMFVHWKDINLLKKNKKLIDLILL